MAKRYHPEVIANAKRFFVQENWSPRKISEFYDGSPHWQTVKNWAEEEDPETGKNWYDERREFIDSIVNAITPEMISQLFNKRVYDTLSDPEFGPNHADRLSKLMKGYEKVTDPSNRVPVIYGMLQDQLDFLEKYYPDLVNEEFLHAHRDFKNYQRDKLIKQ